MSKKTADDFKQGMATKAINKNKISILTRVLGTKIVM
jgi:hypothetical protein